MNKLLIILLFAYFPATCQVMSFGILKNQPVPGDQPLLIVFGGESNSGGIADNTSASSEELDVRTLPILNNTSLTAFDFLNIGTNNLTGHVGLNYAAATGHGWELQLANRFEDGDFGSREVFLCKAGQGGTTIAQWADEATYSAESQTVEPYDTFIERVQAAISIIEDETGQTPFVVMFYSQGINDISLGTSTATWKTATKNLFNLMRSDLGLTLPIFITQFQSMAGYTSYDATIAEIASEMSNVYAINTTGAETSDVIAGAGFHWGYAGMKLVADELVDLLLTLL